MTAPTRSVPVALSAEALLHQWARQSEAPAGAAVVAASEIAARRRGGVEWRTSDAMAVSVLARPDSLDPEAMDVGWAAVSLAAAEALEACEKPDTTTCSTADRDARTHQTQDARTHQTQDARTHQTQDARTHQTQGDSLEACEKPGAWMCLWPDQVLREPPDVCEVAVGFACTLGPGRVELAALTVRVGPLASVSERETVTSMLLQHLRKQASGLDDPTSLLDAYRKRCATLGQPVELRMLPHGTMRGLAEDIDHTGRLVLASPTGLTERIMVASLNEARLLT